MSRWIAPLLAASVALGSFPALARTSADTGAKKARKKAKKSAKKAERK